MNFFPKPKSDFPEVTRLVDVGYAEESLAGYLHAGARESWCIYKKGGGGGFAWDRRRRSPIQPAVGFKGPMLLLFVPLCSALHSRSSVVVVVGEELRSFFFFTTPPSGFLGNESWCQQAPHGRRAGATALDSDLLVAGGKSEPDWRWLMKRSDSLCERDMRILTGWVVSQIDLRTQQLEFFDFILYLSRVRLWKSMVLWRTQPFFDRVW